jgi:hypothetical protein
MGEEVKGRCIQCCWLGAFAYCKLPSQRLFQVTHR